MTRLTEVRLLWCATVAAMAASWSHLASWIASWEYAGASSLVIGCVAATAVDLGILAAMRSQDKLASMSRPTTGPRRTVYFLACVSMVANVAHALDARASRIGPPDATWEAAAWRIAGAIVVAGVLPLIVIRLSHLLDTVMQATTQDMTTEDATQADATDESTATRRTRRRAPARPADDASARAGVNTAPEANVALQVRQGLASVAADASMREIARIAGVSDASVRRLVRSGALRHDGNGWSMAA